MNNLQLERFYDELKEAGLTTDLLIKYANLPRMRSGDELKAIREEFIQLRRLVPLLKTTKNCAVCIINRSTQLHHIIPLMCGGDNDPLNLVPICEECHAVVHPWMKKQLSELYKEIEIMLIEYGSAYKELNKEPIIDGYGYKVAELRRETIAKIFDALDY
jgi:hypothetical protein